MTTHKPDIQQLLRQPDLVAVMLPARDVFGFLGRALRLPSDFAALVLREQGVRTVVPSGGDVPSDGAKEVLFVRTSPLEIAFSVRELPTQDRYLCSVTVGIRAAVVPERAEFDSFRGRLMGSQSQVRLPAIVRHFESGLTDALRQFCALHEVEDLADGKLREAAAACVRKAAQAPCFEAGLSLDGPVQVEFASQALREVRTQTARAAKRLEEHAAHQQVESALTEARSKHLDQLEKTLKKLQSLSAEAPQASLPELLRTFGEAERGKLYAALFESQPPRPATRWLVAACGPHLLFFSPDAFDTPARRLTLEGPIGPLRSVQCVRLDDGQVRLLAGAARGVYELGADSSAAEVVYQADGADAVKGGVNAVAVQGDQIYATHSELGLISWQRGPSEKSTQVHVELTRGRRAIRNVHVSGDRVVFSADDRVIAFRPGVEAEPAAFTGSRATITAALAVDEDIYAGNAEGDVLHWPAGESAAPRVLHGGSGRAAESIAALSVGGVPRLLYTDTTLAVFARVLGDTFVWRYEAGGQTLRRVDAASDLIVGTTDARDRLVIWRPHRPAVPVATINVARLTGHTVQDVALVPI